MSAQDPPPSGWRQQQPDWQRQEPEQPPAESYPPPPAGYSYLGATAGAPAGVPLAAGEPAEWWRRAVAIILDGLVLIIPTLIITAPFGFNNTEIDPITGATTFDSGSFALSSLVSLAVTLVYFGLLDGSARGQSVGKMALGIRVRDVETGGPIGFGRAVLRRLVYSILWYLLVIPGLINALSPLWDARRQAWHDKAANTLVVRAT
jgi:uncharacterized RDD family membrane protein YckC